MDWERGNAIKKEVSNDKPLDLKKIKYRIAYIVNMELDKHINQPKNDNNEFGKWILK
jgi:hypothetical protein|tara:strand:+ start:345 stop:515 length:171 start_codon:yes stop_codon:yes gene_type:complete